jgi:hypothetical protein
MNAIWKWAVMQSRRPDIKSIMRLRLHYSNENVSSVCFAVALRMLKVAFVWHSGGAGGE